MRRVKFLLIQIVAALILTSCGSSDDDPVLRDTASYKIVLEAVGEDYTAQAIVINPDNVSFFDDTKNIDLKQSSVTEYFTGTKTYSTTKQVQYISVQGIILSKTKATLKMTVYQDGKEIYQNSVSVPDSENDTRSLHYTNIKD